jgi:hypothetical protein
MEEWLDEVGDLSHVAPALVGEMFGENGFAVILHPLVIILTIHDVGFDQDLGQGAQASDGFLRFQ